VVRCVRAARAKDGRVKFTKRVIERFEVPTWGLALTIYGGWLALMFWWHMLPLWCAAPMGAWLCAWHMSLQHELIHGHPTRHEVINHALGWPPLNLWLPYAIYRDSHLRHHNDDRLTDPIDDPESTYMSPAAWAKAGAARRWVHRACNTLAGRLVLGPPWAIAQFWIAQARRGQKDAARVWLGHGVGVALVLAWVSLICGVNPIIYVVCCVYPGTALIMLRSLAEHRAAERPEDRTAVVEHAGLLGVLFLNNNLHVLHHAQPSIPWFALPAAWRRARTELMAARRGPVYHDYLDVARRYAVRPQHHGPYPGTNGAAS
jgi:fatty acid desaturase